MKESWMPTMPTALQVTTQPLEPAAAANAAAGQATPPAAHGIDLLQLVLHASLPVQIVMVLLLLASLGLFVAWIMGRHARRLGETSRDPSMMIDPAELRRLRELAEARRTATPPPTEPPAP